EFGKAAVVREGRDATVVALALMVRRALAACGRLGGGGGAVGGVGPRTGAAPVGGTHLRAGPKTRRRPVCGEGFSPLLPGGEVGAEVAAPVADAGFNDLDAPVRRLHGAFTPTPYSPPLEKAVVPQVEDIERAIRQLLEE